MKKITQDDVERMRDIVHTVLYQWDSQDLEIQSEIKNIMEFSRYNLEKIEQRERENTRLRQIERRETARNRKAVRDELIPTWCEENLEPGMIVKVKANSATRLREIESVCPGETMAHGYRFDGHLTGRHVRYARRRNPETGEVSHELVREGYITEHVLRNVQGIVTDFDEQGKPVVTPIMEIIEGK